MKKTKNPPTRVLPDETKFFVDCKNRIKNGNRSRNLLLCIPIWGWTGAGKTCALLTVQHYADPAEHAVGLRILSDRSEMERLEASSDEYRSLQLGALADATRLRIASISEGFIDKGIWPVGTDEPTPYFLGIRTLAENIGYVFFPDLPGGSFQASDDVALEVLKAAHACLALVEADQYLSTTSQGKLYRDEVEGLISRSAETGVPLCVALTKADRYHGTTTADEAQNRLALVVAAHKEARIEILRVSVIGESSESEANELPPNDKRRPEQLLRAFVWTITEALGRPEGEIRGRIPPVTLNAIERKQRGTGATPIPEVRRIGEFSRGFGVAVAAGIDLGDVVFANAAGELALASVNDSTQPNFQPVGLTGEPPEDVTQLTGRVVGGQFILGLRRAANVIWRGALGDTMLRGALPVKMVSWAPLTHDRIIAVDESGRLHSLKWIGLNSRWEQTEFLGDFVAPGTVLTCGVIDSVLAVVATGTSIEAVAVKGDGRFGDRQSIGLELEFDTETAEINNMGVIAAITSAGELVTSSGEKEQLVGSILADAPIKFALAQDAPLIAFVGDDGRFKMAIVERESVRLTDEQHSPVLPSPPESIVWTRNGECVVVTHADGTWASYRPMGLRV